MIDDMVCAMARHTPPLVTNLSHLSQLHKEERVIVSQLRDILDAYHKTQCDCVYVWDDEVWLADRCLDPSDAHKLSLFEADKMRPFPKGFPGNPRRWNIRGAVNSLGDEPEPYTLIFLGSQVMSSENGMFYPALSV